jgi:hypothetical protein
MFAFTTPIFFSRFIVLLAIASLAAALDAVVLEAPPIQPRRYAPPARQMRIMICLASSCLDTGVDVRTRYGYTYGTYLWPQVETWEMK